LDRNRLQRSRLTIASAHLQLRLTFIEQLSQLCVVSSQLCVVSSRIIKQLAQGRA
jgi:hypothetical protein